MLVTVTAKPRTSSSPPSKIDAPDDQRDARLLDELLARVREIDAYASAADAATEAIPYVDDPVRRRRLNQLTDLVIATAKAARRAANFMGAKPTWPGGNTIPIFDDPTDEAAFWSAYDFTAFGANGRWETLDGPRTPTRERGHRAESLRRSKAVTRRRGTPRGAKR